MTQYDVANGALVLAAGACAFGVNADARRFTVALAIVFAANWLHFVTSYSTPLASLFWGYGLYVESQDIWKIVDALTGMVALVCAVNGRAWWGWAIYGLSIAQLLAHFTYWEAGMVSARAYYPVLDGLFLAQVGVFIMAGGRGIVSRVGRNIGRIRLRGLGGPSRKHIEASS